MTRVPGWARRLLLLVALLAEPICHAFGIPHPEGLGTQAANLLATTPEVTT